MRQYCRIIGRGRRARYAIGDLADLGGVSRRTVRYYVQEDLLPPPFGVGRGNHYGQEHLDQLRRVKALQEAGHTLDEIRRALAKGRPVSAVAAPRSASRRSDRSRSLWRRLPLAPGVELHVAGASLPRGSRRSSAGAVNSPGGVDAISRPRDPG